MSPNSSNGSKSALLTLAMTVPAAGLVAGAAAAFGAGGGGGGASAFLVSKDPTWSFPLYFLRIPAMTNQCLRDG